MSSGKSSPPSGWPSLLDMSQRELFPPQSGLPLGTSSTHDCPSNSANLPRNSSKRPSSSRSRRRMRGALTITIKFTCPHCLEEHTLDFPLSSSMRRKTSPPLIMKCSTTSAEVALLQWVTLGKVSMVFVERCKAAWQSSRPTSGWPRRTSRSASVARRR